jgi:2-polyprenyl-3-methyl-5-hydroxy-6-metoxy-1,4-benzoquinol methylase
MSINQTTPDYGYHTARRAWDADYVQRPVLELCQSLNARRVLDLGCGNGDFCRQLAAAGFETVGCDPSESGVRLAQQAVPGVTFRQIGVYDPPESLAEQPFDVVVAMEVIEHLYLPRELCRFARGVLRDGGTLIITTPYHGYVKNLLLSLLNKWDAHLSPGWDGGHIKFWSPITLREVVESEGFEQIQFVGAGRLPWLWKSMVVAFRAGPRTATSPLAFSP